MAYDQPQMETPVTTFIIKNTIKDIVVIIIIIAINIVILFLP